MNLVVKLANYGASRHCAHSSASSCRLFSPLQGLNRSILGARCPHIRILGSTIEPTSDPCNCTPNMHRNQAHQHVTRLSAAQYCISLRRHPQPRNAGIGFTSAHLISSSVHWFPLCMAAFTGTSTSRSILATHQMTLWRFFWEPMCM